MTSPARRLVVFIPLLFVGCSPTPPVAGIKLSATLTLYEGLPHQLYERAELEQEKKKPTVQLDGFLFYREPLELKEADRQALKVLIGDPGSLEAYSGEKTCGGFHPDYAIEWNEGGKAYRYLICFGCGEARVITPAGEIVYDIAPRAKERLKTLLSPYRKNRPDTGHAGP
jgi:hypothetical protein